MGRIKRFRKYRKLNPSVTMRVPYTLYKQIWEIGKSKDLTLVDAGKILSKRIKEKKIIEEIKKER